MKTWRCTGSTALTRSPRPELSTGTSRQPISVWPSAAIASSTIFSTTRARVGVARHEELADGVMARLGQREAELGAFLREEAVRDLRQHAAAVAERRVGAGRAAVVEVDQDLQALFQDRVRLCGCSCRRRSRRRRNRARWRGRRGPGARGRHGSAPSGSGAARVSICVSGLRVHLSAPRRGAVAAPYRVFGLSNAVARVGQGRRRRRPPEIRRGVLRSFCYRAIRRPT